MSDKRIYRVDKFQVPEAARVELMEKVHATHQVLRNQPGFLEDSILEQVGGPGRFNLVTVVVWESAEVMEGAKAAVAAKHQEMGFKPAEVLQRLGIEADIATYKAV